MRKNAQILMIVINALMFYTACDGDDNGENSAGPPGSPAECVPNEDLPNSMCLAADLLVACNPYLYLCQVQFPPGPLIGFVFPSNIYLVHTFGARSASQDCTAIVNCAVGDDPNQDAGVTFTDLRIEDGILRGTVVRESDSNEAPLEDCRQVDPNSI